MMRHFPVSTKLLSIISLQVNGWKSMQIDKLPTLRKRFLEQHEKTFKGACKWVKWLCRARSSRNRLPKTIE